MEGLRLRKLLVVAALVAAQAPAPPSFDVASIKPRAPGSGDRYGGGDRYLSTVQPGGRYLAANVTLRLLMRIAYGVHESQIIGGPAWMNTERFDVSAKADGYPDAAAFRDQARLMLRSLLADRFKLTFRREQRELSIYAMVVAKAGELGPRLRRDDGSDCATPKVVFPKPGAPDGGAPLVCGGEMFTSGILVARALPLSTLALTATRVADRVVVDETELPGKFDWDIFWLPDDLALRDPRISGPSMFTALLEQAGLKLESRRRQIDVFVIERAERPEPD